MAVFNEDLEKAAEAFALQKRQNDAAARQIADRQALGMGVTKVDLASVKDAAFSAPIRRRIVPISPEWEKMQDDARKSKSFAPVVGMVPMARKVDGEGATEVEVGRKPLVRSNKNKRPIALSEAQATAIGDALLAKADKASAKAASKAPDTFIRTASGDPIVDRAWKDAEAFQARASALKPKAKPKGVVFFALVESEASGTTAQWEGVDDPAVHVSRAKRLGLKILALIPQEKDEADAYTVRITFEGCGEKGAKTLVSLYPTSDKAVRGAKRLLAEANAQGNAILAEVYIIDTGAKTMTLTRRDYLEGLTAPKSDVKKTAASFPLCLAANEILANDKRAQALAAIEAAKPAAVEAAKQYMGFEAWKDQLRAR